MFRAPRGTPPLRFMLADLPATPAQVAHHLAITPRTMQRYLAADQAPRAVMLALFWETRWGRSAADTEAANWAALHYRRAMILERENAALLRQIGLLEAERSQVEHLAANGPAWRVG